MVQLLPHSSFTVQVIVSESLALVGKEVNVSFAVANNL